MSPVLLLLAYCLLVTCASVVGGRLSSILQMTHLRTQLLMSGVGGLMLGIALLHLLPHGAEILGSSSKMGMSALAGLIVMFLLIRLFHTHDHGLPGDVSEDIHQHSECHHDHDNDHGPVAKRISWLGLFFGLALHTLIDGIALASSVLADAQHGAWLGLAGLGTFLAVVLHKPLDAFAIASVMGKQNWSPSAQSLANIAFSLACPLGAAAFYLGATRVTGGDAFLGWGLVVSAGFFIGIALADLLPEVAFHDHDRGKLTFALLLGVAIAAGIENLPGHRHTAHTLEHEHQHEHGQH